MNLKETGNSRKSVHNPISKTNVGTVCSGKILSYFYCLVSRIKNYYAVSYSFLLQFSKRAAGGNIATLCKWSAALGLEGENAQGHRK